MSTPNLWDGQWKAVVVSSGRGQWLMKMSAVEHLREMLAMRACVRARWMPIRCAATSTFVLCCVVLCCVALRCVALRCGAVRCGAVRCGAVRASHGGEVRCGARCGGMERCGVALRARGRDGRRHTHLVALYTCGTRQMSAMVISSPNEYFPLVALSFSSSAAKPWLIAHCPHSILCSRPCLARTRRFCTG
jgi:hypothetical protein